LTLGQDGSLQNYKMLKRSGDDTTDRSIISAVEMSVPLLNPPRGMGIYSDIVYTFNYKLVKKSVTY